MIVAQAARTNTHSASAIYRMARGFPALRRAVRVLPRSWWHAAVRRYGAEHAVGPRYYEGTSFFLSWTLAPWTVVSTRTPAWTVIAEETRIGTTFLRVWLAPPALVLARAGRAAGLTCSECGLAKPEATFPLTEAGMAYSPHHVVCAECSARTRGGEKAMLLRLARRLEKEAREAKADKEAA